MVINEKKIVDPMPTIANPVPVAQPVAKQIGPTGYVAPDYTEQYKSLAEAQKAQKVAELQQAYEKSLGQTKVEQEGMQRQFEQGVGQTRTQSTLDARKFEDFIRTRGLGQSGAASQGAIAQNVALQGNLGRLESQRLLGEQDIGRRQTQMLSDLEFGKTQATSQVDMQMTQNLLQDRQRADERSYNFAMTKDQQAYQQKLMQMGWSREDAIRESERQFRKEETAEQRAYQEQLMQKGWDREDAIRETDRVFRKEETAEQRAYQERLMQMGWTREDALREADRQFAKEDTAEQRAYQERLMQMGWSREDAQLESQRAYNEQLTQRNWEREDTLNAGRLTPGQQEEIGNIGQYQGDYQSEINRRQATPDPSDDWLIPYLQAARQQKIQSQGLDQQGRPIPVPQEPVDTTPNLTSSSAAMDLWKALGTANEAIARALGVPVGTRYQAPKSTSTSGTTKTPTQPLW